MKITFERNGKKFTGTVVSRGFFNVDAPESFEIEIDGLQHIRMIVPVSECEEI